MLKTAAHFYSALKTVTKAI